MIFCIRIKKKFIIKQLSIEFWLDVSLIFKNLTYFNSWTYVSLCDSYSRKSKWVSSTFYNVLIVL